MLSDAELLAIQFRTAFVCDRLGRILATNDPDRSPAPRFALFGCTSSNIYAVRADVSDAIAAQLMDLAASEPPFFDRLGTPRHLDRYIELLSYDAVALRPGLEMSYVLPNDIAYQHDVRLICSDSPEGQELLATLATKGIPTGSPKWDSPTSRSSGIHGALRYTTRRWPRWHLRRAFPKRERVLDWPLLPSIEAEATQQPRQPDGRAFRRFDRVRSSTVPARRISRHSEL